VIGGVVLAVLAALCFEGGYVVQALEVRAEGERPGWLLGRLVRRSGWVAGFVLSVVGAGLQVLALTMAPLTVVQPVLALGLVLLLVLAHVVLHEPVGRSEIGGVAAIVAGVAVIVLVAPDAQLGTVDVQGMAVLLSLLAAGALGGRLLGARDPRPLVVCAALGDAFAAIALKLVADAAGHGSWLPALAWAAAAGLAGIVALGAEMRALQGLPATRVAPVVLAAQVLVPAVAGALLFGERWGDTPLGGAVIGAAVLLVAGGAAVLGGSRPVALAVGRGEDQARG
jgi:drug/metabolite transporter (DMT)-like permease